MSGAAPELAPIPEGWEAHRAPDGLKFIHTEGLYVDVVIVETFAVQPCWADELEELAALVAMLAWLHVTWSSVTRHHFDEPLAVARAALTKLCGLGGAT
jgi:hypothetical protein